MSSDSRFVMLVETAGALPWFIVTPFLRPWHARWGATESEIRSPMPGDELVKHTHLNATRSITIGAPPDRVWPWIVQIGMGRAGFYSYDLLDNAGKCSAERIVPELQNIQIGDWISMTAKPSETTAFKIEGFDAPHWMLWRKPDSTWAWRLESIDSSATRLVTRLRCEYDWSRPLAALSGLLLMEIADFAMMRKQLLGLKERAERTRSGDET